MAAKVGAHAMAGGVMSELQGGKFGHGFASAGVTQLLAPAIDHVDSDNSGFSSARVAVAALVGGTTSAATGGKFANGALTAAFSRAYNDEMDKVPESRRLSHADDPNIPEQGFTSKESALRYGLDLAIAAAEKGDFADEWGGGVVWTGEEEGGFYPTQPVTT